MTRTLFCLIFLPLLISCRETLEKEVKKIDCVTTCVDSTLYYDSIFLKTKLHIDNYFEGLEIADIFSGTVLFAQGDYIIHKKAYGMADYRSKDSMELDHSFQLASASKPFTAIAIMQLVQNGQLQLDDTITKFFDNFPYPNITVSNLLCHRSGLSHYTHFCDNPASIWPDRQKTITNKDVLKIIDSIKPFHTKPNQKHYYCNTNYLLLAEIVEKVSGLSFENYLEKNIFIPLNMTGAKLFRRDNVEELIKPCVGYYGNYTPCENTYLNGCVGDKGIYANVDDLFAFSRGLDNETILNRKYKDLAFDDHNDTDNRGKNYGYGFRILYTKNKGRLVYHTGWWKGFRTYFIKIPEFDQTAIVLTNLKRGQFLSIEKLASLISTNPDTLAEESNDLNEPEEN